jgi:hypothetical protein
VWSIYYEKNPAKAAVQSRLAAVTDEDLKRPSPFAERRPSQLKNLPILPTTTIGSFPQTPQIRALRRKLKAGEITLGHYQAKIDEQIAFNIGIQEALGLDILSRRARAYGYGGVLCGEAGRVRVHAERLGAVVRFPLCASSGDLCRLGASD